MFRQGREVEHEGPGHGDVHGWEGELSTVCALYGEGEIPEMYLRSEGESSG
jgi:hypothetical protein